MTTHANSLTDRVTLPAGTTARSWTMSGTDTRTFIDSLGRLGYDSRSLTAAAGLDDGELNDPDARIPCEALGTIVSRAQQQRFTPNLGLELARITPLGAYPLLDYVVVTSDTVESGVQQLSRYMRLVGSPIVLESHDEDTEHVRVQMTGAVPPFSLEFHAALMALHLGREADGTFAVASISFQHTPDDVASFEQILGCVVRAGAAWNGLLVPRTSWRLPLRRRDPVLRHMLEGQADQVLARLPTRTGVALDVQRALATRVVGGETRIGVVARELAMSGRTLQRRLAAEGLSYQQLLDDARKEAAGRYLSEPALAIGEVAYLVGYSEPAPFHRAFKRWYGMTPEIFRQKRRE